MTTAEETRTWADVVSTDYVWSVKRGAWFEVIEVWQKGPRTHFRLRDAKATQDLPSTTPVRVRRSDMGAAVDIVVGIMSSGPNGYRDAGTDQMDPFISRVRGLKSVADARAEAEGRPRTEWTAARRRVLDEAHNQALEANR